MDELATLRAFIVEVLVEGSGWEDPEVVLFHGPDLEDDEEPDPDEVESGSTYKLEKSSEQNLGLHQRDSYSRANKSMASMKPLAPTSHGGAKSGRQPGNTAAAPRSRGYSQGY